ncbi:MAG: YCF48-related protein, partial [Melioribacteraceae bacterium]|nr:YCF48-related protein [Melioribacteraceae bacterium]
ESGLGGRLSLLFNGNWLEQSQDYQGTNSKQRVSYVLQNTGDYYIRYSYLGNYNGIPSNEKQEEYANNKDSGINKNSLKEKEITAWDNGAYTIRLEYFKVDKPEYNYVNYYDITFKDIRFSGEFYPNGLETEAVIEYGTTDNYGTEFYLSTVNGVSRQYFNSAKLTGLEANTLYHYRLKLTNSKGNTYSNDMIFTTSKAPEGWEIVLNNGSYFLDLEFLNKDIGYASGEGGIYKTIDGGKTWISKYSSNWITGIGIASENKILGVADWQLFISENGGDTWTQTNLGGNLCDITFYNSQIGAIWGYGCIWKTTDGGTNWIKVFEYNSNLFEIDFVTENIIVAIGDNRKVFRTTDGGTSWSETQLSDGYSYSGLDFYGSTGFIVGADNVIYRTDDTGETWTRVLNNTSYSNYSSVEMLNENTIYVTGLWNSISLRSLDGGDTWQNEEIGTSNGIQQLASAEGRIFGCGEYGTIIRQTKMAIVDKFVNLESGWNMLSVPCQFQDMSFSNLFINTISNAWQYDNGYKDALNATVGIGYWMRFSQAQQVHFSGMSADVTKIPVKQGWNMVGFDDRELPVSSVTTDPEGLISTSFFGYSSGYQIPNTLLPGKGYWIRVKSDGDLVIPENLSKAMYVDNANAPTINEKWSKIIVSNSIGESGVLYNVLGENINLERYEIPPAPPAGIFDVRYGTERFAENLTETGTEIKIQSGSYPIRIKPEGMDIKISDGSGKFEKVIRNGDEYIIQNESQSRIYVSMIEIPITYELMQNYPNPFNPSTIIKFGLPESGKVTLSIFNILGEKVTDLINKELEAGYHEIKWDASYLSSGMYIYTISTGKFRDVKKMLLMK